MDRREPLLVPGVWACGSHDIWLDALDLESMNFFLWGRTVSMGEIETET